MSSIIVDGPAFNPTLDDGCGRFKVKHFGVATTGSFSSFTILKLIRQIVSQNLDINGNRQSDEGTISIPEKNARKMYRKWDNVKHICESINHKGRPRQVYGQGLWGLSIKTKERSDSKAGRGLSFGIVITLKEMHGVNRIDDFIKMCMARGWLVNKLDIEQQINIYQKSEEEIDFE